MSFANKKVTIIGLGFLMEYIFPCFRAAMGERTAVQINAVTADEGDLEGKHKRLGIPVFLNDNLAALEAMQPDYIFFAPPPTVAPVLTESVLKQYYSICRSAGRPCPGLIAFPPSPKGAYYQEQLGSDLKVVNIIPNMISRVGSEAVPTEHCHMVTYPQTNNFTCEEKEELKEFFAPMGRWLEVPPNLILQVLSAEIACHPLTELCDITARALTEKGKEYDYRQVAGTMRAHHQAKRGYTSPGTNNCRLDEVPDERMAQFLGELVDSWYDGLYEYMTGEGFPAAQAKALLDPRVDLLLHETQLETREEIVAKAKKDATPGGMLELCMQRYFLNAEPLIKWLVEDACKGNFNDPKDLGRIMTEITRAVVERGSGLTKNRILTIGAEHHAVLFGVMAKAAMELLGGSGDGFLHDAVKRYGRERGRRMRLRCEKNGDPVHDMASYFAYGEWGVTGGFEKTAPEQECPYLHYHVLKCPWCTAWEKAGLQEYGTYYCRDVDASILEGFDPGMSMELPEWHSRPGSEGYCDFNWLSAENTPERFERQKAIQARIKDSAKKDFAYHCAHEYSVFMDEMGKKVPELISEFESRVWEAFAKAYSHTELLMILELEDKDFLSID